MATAAREDVAGGCTAFAAASLIITTKITASAARASPRPANAKRQQQTVLGRHNLNARRPGMGGVRSLSLMGGLVRGRILARSLRCLSYSSCNIEAGAPGRQEIIFPGVLRAGVTAVIVVFFFVVFGALFFLELFFIFILQHRRTVHLATSSDILYERELYKQFVPPQLTRVHNVLLSPSTSPGRSWLGCSPKLLLYLFLQQTLVGSTGSNHTCRRKESLPMPLELHSTVVSIHFVLY